MAATYIPYEPKKYRKEWQSNFRLYKQRAYNLGIGADLTGTALEPGQTIPDDSEYEIIKANMDTVVDKAGTVTRFVVVVGFKIQTE